VKRVKRVKRVKQVKQVKQVNQVRRAPQVHRLHSSHSHSDLASLPARWAPAQAAASRIAEKETGREMTALWRGGRGVPSDDLVSS